MFGTIFRMMPQPGKEQAVLDHFKPEGHERITRIAGLQHSFLLRSTSHPGELVCMAIFDDEQTFRNNSKDPEQDQWYQTLRAMLQADPEWNDGQVIDNFKSVKEGSSKR